MQAQLVSATYMVEVPEDKFLLILDSDSERHQSETLVAKLGEAGAENIEYEGFYGSNVWFMCDYGDEDKFIQIIQSFIDGLTR